MARRSSTLAFLLLVTFSLLNPGATSSAQESSGEDVRFYPKAFTVARRVLVLEAVYALRLFPRQGEKIPEPMIEQSEEERQRILDWMEREKLWPHASPWESKVLRAEVGSLSREDGMRISRQRESIAVLLHAIGIVPKPPPYRPRYGFQGALKRLPRIGEDTLPFLRRAKLRERDQLQKQLEIAELWHWRCQTAELIRSQTYPSGEAFAIAVRDVQEQERAIGLEVKPIDNGRTLLNELIRFSAHWAAGEGMAAAPIDDDFPVKGRPYRDLEVKDQRRLFDIARERHRTLNWLNGKGKDWDKVTAEL